MVVKFGHCPVLVSIELMLHGTIALDEFSIVAGERVSDLFNIFATHYHCHILLIKGDCFFGVHCIVLKM